MARTCISARLVLSLLFVAVASTVRSDDTAYTLRYRFTPGESVYYTTVNSTSRKFQQAEQEIETDDSVNALKHYRVLSVEPNGNAVLELMIDRTRMQVARGESVFTYDSAVDKSPPEAFLQVHSTVGRPWLHVTVSPRGETTEYKTPGGVPVPESPDFVSRVLPELPEQPVKIGDTWKDQFVVDVPTGDIQVAEGKPLTKPIRMQRVYQLKSVDNGIATLSLKTEILTGARTPKDEVSLVQRKFVGTLTIDIDKGRLTGRDLSIDGSVVGYDGPMSAMKVKMTHQDAYAPAGAATALGDTAGEIRK